MTISLPRLDVVRSGVGIDGWGYGSIVINKIYLIPPCGR
jgi:hypothetical protein